MPFIPISMGMKNPPAIKYNKFNWPVTFYDRVTFVGPDSSIEFLGGKIVGDLMSVNWDGGFDLTTVDTAATVGFYLDSEIGAAQFMGSMWVGGDFRIIAPGIFATGLATDSRIEIAAGSGAYGYVVQDNYIYDGTSLKNYLQDRLQIQAAATDRYWYFERFGSTTEYMNVRRDSYGNMMLFLNTAVASADSYLYVVGTSGEIRIGSDGNLSYGSALNFTNGTTRRFNMSTTYLTGAGTSGGIALKSTAGTAAAPAYSFVDDLDTGMYSSGANTIGFSYGGTQHTNFSSSGMFLYGAAASSYVSKESGYDLYLRNAVANRHIFFSTDDGTGSANRMQLRGSEDIIYWYDTAGAEVYCITGAQAAGQIRFYGDGSLAAPTYSWRSDPNTGMYLAATAQIGWSINGVQEMLLSSTGFLVPNVYNAQAGASANVYVASGGQLTRLTSALKYKTDVHDAPQLADLTLRPVEYVSKQHGTHHYGLIADDIASQLVEAGIYGDDGSVEDYDTRAVIGVMAAKINRLEKQLTELLESGILPSPPKEKNHATE